MNDVAEDVDDNFEFPEGFALKEYTDFYDGDVRIYKTVINDTHLKTHDIKHRFKVVVDTTEAFKLYDFEMETGGDPYPVNLERLSMLEDTIAFMIIGSCEIELLIEYEDDLTNGHGPTGMRVTFGFTDINDVGVVKLVVGKTRC